LNKVTRHNRVVPQTPDPAVERRRVRDRARTLLTVDETVAKIDATADALGVQLDRFSDALDRFSVALDRFSDAAEKIDQVSGKLDTISDRLGAFLGVTDLVNVPVGLARKGVRKALGRDGGAAQPAEPPSA
jgi:hypothetical protein